MQRLVSLIVNAYSAQPALDRQLAHWAGYPRALLEQVELVVVDDGSPVPLQLPADALPAGGRVVLGRIQQDIAWNMPGARNLGAMLAGGRFLLFHDIDHFLPAASLSLLLGNAASLAADTLYRFHRLENGQPINSHVNSFLCARDGFLRIGGYDEDFAGHYGHEDSFFLNTWTARNGPMVMLNNVWLDAQPRFSTTGLDRDTTRNTALYQHKTAAGGADAMAPRLRFPWSMQVLAA